MRAALIEPHVLWDRRGSPLAFLAQVVRGVNACTRQALCGLRGHEMVLHFEPARLSLKCVACGAETPGWTIDVRPVFRSRGPARARKAAARESRLDVATPPSGGSLNTRAHA